MPVLTLDNIICYNSEGKNSAITQRSKCADGGRVVADPEEQQLLAEAAQFISRLVDAAPQRAIDERLNQRVKQHRGPREKSLAARHMANRAFQRALHGKHTLPPTHPPSCLHNIN